MATLKIDLRKGDALIELVCGTTYISLKAEEFQITKDENGTATISMSLSRCLSGKFGGNMSGDASQFEADPEALTAVRIHHKEVNLSMARWLKNWGLGFDDLKLLVLHFSSPLKYDLRSVRGSSECAEIEINRDYQIKLLPAPIDLSR